MRAVSLSLALGLLGILTMLQAGVCMAASPMVMSANPDSAHLQTSDTPIHPGTKSAKPTQGQLAEGDEPGDQSSHANKPAQTSTHDATSSATTDAETLNPRMDANAGFSTHKRSSAYSAVLDTLGPAGDRTPADTSGVPQTLGLVLRPLSAAERASFGVSAGGLLVTGVSQGTAQRAGFRQGDVLLMLDGIGITSTTQFHKLMQQLPHDRPVPVLVHRPTSNLFLPLGSAAHG